MWRKVLVWFSLVANAIWLGLCIALMAYTGSQGNEAPVVYRVIGVTVVGAILCVPPATAILTALFGTPILKPKEMPRDLPSIFE